MNRKDSPKPSEGLKQLLEEGGLVKTALKYSPEQLEALYAKGFRFYKSGKYEEAASVFQLLTYVDPTEARFIMGLASSAHMRKDFATALKMYELAGTLSPNNPLPFFYASDCCIALNNAGQAAEMLRKAIRSAGDKPEHQVLKDKSLLTLQSLSL